MEDKVEGTQEKENDMKHRHVQDELMTCGAAKTNDNNSTQM